MNKKEKLEMLFREFPGVGPRQAGRFVHALLYKNRNYLEELSRLILEIKEGTRKCQRCNRFFQENNQNHICSICGDERRDRTKLLIIEKNPDFENIENSGIWNGLYFLIGKNLKLTEKEPEKKINLESLKKQLENNPVEEVTFALSLTPEGEQTKDFLWNFLNPLAKELNFKITELGRGLSLGSEIEYSDKVTLTEAFKNRK